jgi:hypothetical protein
MLQETRAARLSDSQVEALSADFRITHTARLPGLLSTALVQAVHEGLDRGSWTNHEHEGLWREVTLDDVRTLALLHFVANTPVFLGLVREITGSEAITRFEGRVYRMMPGADHYDSWHHDAIAHRVVGMSLNLGPTPYAGGTFQLRMEGEHAVRQELPNTGPGDAILFRISAALEHRVTPVLGNVAKTAFAGWFFNDGADFFSKCLGPAHPVAQR